MNTDFSTLSLPKLFLHVEAASIFFFSLVAYHYIQGNWLLFLLLLLAPDLFMIGYLKDPKLGSIIYNTFHMYAWSLLVVLIGTHFKSLILLEIGLIWIAHISIDRVFGFGMKYPSAFKETHFNRI